MRISFLDDEPEIFPMQYGGKARTIVNIAKTFSSLPGIEKVSILSRSINTKENEFYWKGIMFKKINGYEILREILSEIGACDILNVHTCSFTMPYIGIGNYGSAKLVYHLHDVIFATSDAGSHLDKAMGNTWSAIISPSEFATTLSNISWWSNIKDKINTIPRGVDLKMFYPVDNDRLKNKFSAFVNSYPILFFPNRYSANKGESFLPELAMIIKKRYPSALILTTNEVNDDLDKTGVIKNVGWIQSEDMKYYYSLSDIVLNFSLIPESFSQVAIESIACGTPMVCFKFGNLSDLSEKIPSLKSCEPNINDIYNTINKILENKDAEKEMNESIEIIKSDYNLATICQEYNDIYKKILNGKDEPFILAEISEIKEERFAISPIAAIYEHCAYISNGGILLKYKLTDQQRKILTYCKIVRKKEDVFDKFKKYGKGINSDLYKLLNINLLIKL